MTAMTQGGNDDDNDKARQKKMPSSGGTVGGGNGRRGGGKQASATATTTKKKTTVGTRLNDAFIVVFGAAFLISLSLNIANLLSEGNGESSSSSSSSSTSAIHKAMQDFTNPSQGIPSSRRRPRRGHDDRGKDGDEGQNNNNHATLQCDSFGGPSQDKAQEMVYWKDIPSDSLYVSPFFKAHQMESKKRSGNNAMLATTKYLTFEPDGGGWNNIRMAMESTIGLAVAMGRTLVMPPQKKMYLLGKTQNSQKHHFSFVDFFPIEEAAADNRALNVISMEEYLLREAMTGKLRNQVTGMVEFPPGNRTNWDGVDQLEYDILRAYLRNVSFTPRWDPGRCLPAFPSSGRHQDVQLLQSLVHKTRDGPSQKINHSSSDLFHVDDPDPLYRLKDTIAQRSELCVYDERLQREDVLHFQCNHKEHLRMLVHFYAFLFFEDWREDLWMKRFVRDHLHYRDEIQCAAARIVRSVRAHVQKRTLGNSTEFDSFHIRRGDFQFKTTRISAEEIYENSKAELTEGSTIFIATDERDMTFFEPLRKHYDLLFLEDFKNELKGVNTNYYGMIDQLVASRGRVFFGCWFSTFTGYINRIRGYHSVKDKKAGYERGELPTTYYYATKEKKFEMHKYAPLKPGYFNRENPTAWRDIDKGIQELAEIATQ